MDASTSGLPYGGLSNCPGGQYWVRNGDPRIIGQMAANGAKDPRLYFATTNPDGSPIFTAPPTGTFNLQPGIRNSIYRPGFENWNIGLYKKFAINERTGFQFRAEAFNAFNHPNFALPASNISSPATVGKITSTVAPTFGTVGPREIDFQLRLEF